MTTPWTRRSILKGLAAASTAIIVPPIRAVGSGEGSSPAGAIEVQVTALSPHTFRLTILPAAKAGESSAVPSDGSLVQESWDNPIEKLHADHEKPITVGNSRLKISLHASKNHHRESTR